MKKIAALIALFLIMTLIFGVTTHFFHNHVKTVQAKRGPIIEAVYGLGKVKTNLKYEVKPGIMSTVEKLFVREGEKVQKGDPLIRLSDADTFHTPLSGTVTLVEAYEDETVLPQITVLRVEDLEETFIEVSLEQEGAIRVRPGQKARILFESVRNQEYRGQVKTIFPRNEEFLAHIEIKNLPKNILPGMTADVAIEVAKHENALLVPLSGIESGQVQILRNGKKKSLPIKVGGIDGSWAEVLEGGIREGDQVIISKEQQTEEEEEKKAFRFGPR